MDASAEGGSSPPFSLLIVCHANHCRSPLAEHLLRQEVDLRQLDWVVSSAGTHVQPGRPMHPAAAAVLARRGLDTRNWTSRLLQPSLIKAADVVLTAGDEQRAIVARMSPSALSRTFTLLQFAYLQRAAAMPRRISPADYGPALLAAVREARGQVQPMPKNERELPDPMGQSSVKFRRCATVIEEAVEQITAGVPLPQWEWSTKVTG